MFQALADVRAGLYGASSEKLKVVAKKAIPRLSLEGVSRAKLLHELEKYLINLDKEEDGGLAILKDISSKLDMKSGVVSKEPGTVPSHLCQLGKKTLRLMAVLEKVHHVLDT